MDPVRKEILTSLSHTHNFPFLSSPSFFFLPLTLSLSLGLSPTRAGQFLCEMDTGLPADRAGMRDGDRLLAVNGEGVEGLCHQEVVDMIRASGNQVTLLVIDPDGDKFFSSVRPSRIAAQCEGWWATGRDANPALFGGSSPTEIPPRAPSAIQCWVTICPWPCGMSR